MSKCDLKNMVISFYNNEYYLIDAKYCKYDLYRVKIAVRLLKKILPYPIFVEFLFDYLASTIDKRDDNCFVHLRHMDCFQYDTCINRVWGRSVPSMIDLYKRREFDLYKPLRIMEVIKVKTRYGDGYNIKFYTESYCYKAWLPRSGFRAIQKCIGDPVSFDFYKKKVYFRIIAFETYKEKPYPLIECSKVK